jgi:hypothetical protein
MSPKAAIPVLIGALAFAPVAYLAQSQQVRMHAFAGSTDVASVSARVARDHRPRPPVELAPVVVRGAVRAPPRAVVTDALPLTCQAWRKLLSGPGAADAAAPMVRACDAAQMLDGSDPPPATARLPQPPRAPPAHRGPWEYTVDMAAPR